MCTINVNFTINELNDIDNFIKSLALKVFIVKEVSNTTKIAILYVFCMKSIFSLVVSTLNVIYRILNDKRANILLWKNIRTYK